MGCLRELFRQELPDGYQLDVYLTDDGCTDGTPEAIADEFPPVHIIKGDGNLFWNRGMYAAWSEAEKYDYDFYLWLNDDTNLLRNALNMLIDTSAKIKHNGIVVGATLDATKTRITYGGWSKEGLITDLQSEDICISFNGNIVLISRSAYLVLGKNDPYFHHSLGDLDYGYRATEKGIPIKVCGSACGICDSHSTIAKWKDPAYSLCDRLKYLYSAGGNGSNPREQFYFRRRHIGLHNAITIYISSHLHSMFPNLWTTIR